jgi:pimeloyl-ACP methyl ester carboxylesterase
MPIAVLDLLRIGPIESPTLYIYGSDDRYLSFIGARLTRRWVRGEYQQLFLPKGTHWIPQESAVELAKAIDGFARGEKVKPWR